MIVAENITKSFGSLEVLKGIDLTIAEKEVVCIIGTSGAGKTTLLQILGTLSQPTGGSLHINGQDILNMSRSKLADFRNKNIGFVFQFHHLLPEFTALENVCIPAFIKGTGKKEAEDRAKELLDFFNLSDRLTHKPRELSGGEQQRIAIARALMNKPSVIFADEPSGNLDTKNKEELHEMFLSLRDQFNQTIVIVTHDTSLAEKSDRIIKMSDGILI